MVILRDFPYQKCFTVEVNHLSPSDHPISPPPQADDLRNFGGTFSRGQWMGREKNPFQIGQLPFGSANYINLGKL